MPSRVFSNLSVWVLLVANLLPLLGVLFWDWDLYFLMMLYWSESAIVGFYAILSLIQETGILSVFLVPFFCVHFGMFMTVHMIFINALFGPPWAKTLHSFPAVLDRLVLQQYFWIPWALLFISHGVAFIQHTFLGKKTGPPPATAASEASGTTPPPPAWAVPLLKMVKKPSADNLMTAPYRRVMVMQVTIIFGGFLSLMFRSNKAAFALLVVLKTFSDLHSHVRFHRLGDGSVEVEGQGNQPEPPKAA